MNTGAHSPMSKARFPQRSSSRGTVGFGCQEMPSADLTAPNLKTYTGQAPVAGGQDATTSGRQTLRVKKENVAPVVGKWLAKLEQEEGNGGLMIDMNVALVPVFRGLMVDRRLAASPVINGPMIDRRLTAAPIMGRPMINRGVAGGTAY